MKYNFIDLFSGAGGLSYGLEKMIEVLNSPEIPISNESCENCAYSRQRLKFDS